MNSDTAQQNSGVRGYPADQAANTKQIDDAASNCSSSSSEDSEFEFKQFIRQEIQSSLMKMSTASVAMSQVNESQSSVKESQQIVEQQQRPEKLPNPNKSNVHPSVHEYAVKPPPQNDLKHSLMALSQSLFDNDKVEDQPSPMPTDVSMRSNRFNFDRQFKMDSEEKQQPELSQRELMRENPYLADQVKHLESPVMVKMPSDKWAQDEVEEEFFDIPANKSEVIDLDQGNNADSSQLAFEIPIEAIDSNQELGNENELETTNRFSDLSNVMELPDADEPIQSEFNIADQIGYDSVILEKPPLKEEDYPKVDQNQQPSQNYDMIPELDDANAEQSEKFKNAKMARKPADHLFPDLSHSQVKNKESIKISARLLRQVRPIEVQEPKKEDEIPKPKRLSFKKQRPGGAGQQQNGSIAQGSKQVLSHINNFLIKASNTVIKNQIAKSFPYSHAAAVIGDTPDQLITINPKRFFARVNWTIKNESEFDWCSQALGKGLMQSQQQFNLNCNKIFQADKKYKLFMTMIEPKDLQVQVVDFTYDSLNSQDSSDLTLDINFKDLNLKKVINEGSNSGYGVIMFRILDEKHIIMGDAKEDNMILFVKFDLDVDQEEALDNEEGAMNCRKLSEGQTMAMASILLDEGYSTKFDRCHKAVICCDGNIDLARDIMSKITITENQHY